MLPDAKVKAVLVQIEMAWPEACETEGGERESGATGAVAGTDTGDHATFGFWPLNEPR
jgi:hypothetical protein